MVQFSIGVALERVNVEIYFQAIKVNFFNFADVASYNSNQKLSIFTKQT